MTLTENYLVKGNTQKEKDTDTEKIFTDLSRTCMIPVKNLTVNIIIGCVKNK